MSSNAPIPPPGSGYAPTGPNWGGLPPQLQQTLQTLTQNIGLILKQLQSITPALTQGSSQAALVAHAGGGQAGATQLSAQFNQITGVANPADSVALPVSAASLLIFLANTTANPCQVFGVGADMINGAAAAAGVSLPAGHSALYFCPIAGFWYSIPTAP